MSHAIYCLNGHYVGLVNSGIQGRASMLRIQAAINSDRTERTAQAFCTTCGARNMSACEACHTPIDHQFPGQTHNYCAGCGKPFPWTETILNSAKEYADELEELSNEEKSTLKSTFDDLTKDSPRTEIAASRFKRILRKVAPDAAEAIRKTIVEIASSTAVKLIRGGPGS